MVLLIFYSDVAEIADEVYMEVIVGEEDAAVAAAAAAAVHEQQMDNNEMKTFMPIAWAAAYGMSCCSLKDCMVLEHEFIIEKHVSRVLSFSSMKYQCSDLSKNRKMK